MYPDLIQHHKITVYDVAPKVLPMFDENLGKYAMETFKREGIQVKTSHHVQELRRGLPAQGKGKENEGDARTGYTLRVKEDGDIGVGMVVWSTGLMMNPFVEQTLHQVQLPPSEEVSFPNLKSNEAANHRWVVEKHPKTGAIITDDRLRVVLQANAPEEEKPRAILKDVYALGDCAVIENTMYPATAQVASQKAKWLAKRLNKGDLDRAGFQFHDLGVMAYIGNWNAIMQSSGGNISGRAAWFIWRGAYLTKSVSLRNKILIPIYWYVLTMNPTTINSLLNGNHTGLSTGSLDEIFPDFDNVALVKEAAQRLFYPSVRR